MSSFLFIIIIFFSLNVTPFVFSLCFLILGSCLSREEGGRERARLACVVVWVLTEPRVAIGWLAIWEHADTKMRGLRILL